MLEGGQSEFHCYDHSVQFNLICLHQVKHLPLDTVPFVKVIQVRGIKIAPSPSKHSNL